MREDPKYQEIETAETKRCRGVVMQKEAELDIARQDLIESRKKQWGPVSLASLSARVQSLGSFPCMTVFDWNAGRFEYAAKAEFDGHALTIGGYRDNDRFNGEIGVYVPLDVSKWQFGIDYSPSDQMHIQ